MKSQKYAIISGRIIEGKRLKTIGLLDMHTVIYSSRLYLLCQLLPVYS